MIKKKRGSFTNRQLNLLVAGVWAYADIMGVNLEEANLDHMNDQQEEITELLDKLEMMGGSDVLTGDWKFQRRK